MPLKWPARGGDSVTLRLTAFFALASTLVLLALGYLVGHAVEQHFVEQDLEILNGKLELIERAVDKVRTAEELPDLARQLDDARAGFSGLALALVVDGEPTIFAGPGGDLPQRLSIAQVTEKVRLENWATADGTPWRGLFVALPLSLSVDPLGVVRVAVALDTSHHAHFMQGFRSTLWSFVLLAAALTGALGYFAVRRGLRPLQAIRQRAESVTARRLDARLPLADFPPELADLVAALNAMLARLETSFVRLSDFSSDLAHEFRTPVSNLLMQAQVTLAHARSPEEYREVLASSIEEYERLSQMIADMLFIAQADEGRLAPAHEPLALAEMAAELVEYYRLLAEDRGVTLNVQGDALGVGDRAMLRRALSNLLANALRHTPPGGMVELLLEQASAEACVTVRNSGSQIAAEHLPYLFDRFYRVDPARQRDGSSTGLGLAIVKSIVEAHGGRVDVSSDAQGTRFFICLPLRTTLTVKSTDGQSHAHRG